jgi:hypothetical protein
MKRRSNEEKISSIGHPNEWEGFEREAEAVVQYQEGETPFDHHPARRKLSKQCAKTEQANRSETKPLPKLAIGTRRKEHLSKEHRRLKQSITSRKDIPLGELTTSMVKTSDTPIFSPHEPIPMGCIPKEMSQTKKMQQSNRYPRVPIVRIEEPSAVYGLIVYRGMEPRTADRFFNSLKDVDYCAPFGQGHTNDRLKEPISFNSKFECGNLNYVLKVLSIGK